jgi:hypothetical protein
MIKYAPVLICTLNRHEHFKSCVESLSKCYLAKETTLFIALDYPKSNSHWDGYNIILDFIPEIVGFKEVVLIKRTKNFGAEDNIRDLQKLVFESYENMIISEDDNLFAISFLEYMNNALFNLRDREDIFSVSGYTSDSILPDYYNKDCYLWCAYSGWGVGMWKNKWEKVDWDLLSFENMLNNSKTKFLLYKYYKRYINQIFRIKENGKITGDGFLLLYMIHNNLYSLFPKQSLVRNIGTDGSGVNATRIRNSKFNSQNIYDGSIVFRIPKNISLDFSLNEFKMREISPGILELVLFYLPKRLKKILKKLL